MAFESIDMSRPEPAERSQPRIHLLKWFQLSAGRDGAARPRVDSTKPASRSTRRCLDTVGCGIRSCRSISPTECCDETSRLKIARRFGSAMISKTDSTLLIYATENILVKAYINQ